MPPPLPFSHYQAEIARHMHQARIADSSAPARPLPESPDERLAQCIWFDSLFLHGHLKTDTGKPLEILAAGRWNDAEGPDFLDAKIRIGGKTLQGDVEVHLDPGGWRQHRHHLDPNYNKVVLHACLRSSEAPRDIRNSNGGRVESFTMRDHLFPDLDTIRQTVHLEDYPYHTPSAIGCCQPLMVTLGEDFVSGMLDAAGDERLEDKAARFAGQAMGVPFRQVFYQAVMTAMGHGPAKSLFFLLSKRAPFHEMADYLLDMERGVRPAEFFQAVLLHVANLAPPENNAGPGGGTEDAESAAYLDRLRGHWRRVEPYFADRVIPPTRQWFSGMRPVNFAQRRLAGVAYLLEKFFLGEGPAARFARVLPEFDPGLAPAQTRRWIDRELALPFEVDEPDDFWTWRYTFTSRRAPRAMKLVGGSRAESIVLNALLPLMLLHARKQPDRPVENAVRAIFHAFPALDGNAITRHMRARLFGDHPRGKTLLNTESRQQGLFHVFRSCCQRNEKDCGDCAYKTMQNAGA